jgi:frataxin
MKIMKILNLNKIFKYRIFKNYPLFMFNTNNKIDPERYVKEVDKTLNYISDYLEGLELEITDNILLADGVLKITLSKNKNYVLNIQRINLQLWLSSPISGPQRFEFDLQSNTWKNNRNNRDLYEILSEEFNKNLIENNIKDINLDFKIKH